MADNVAKAYPCRKLHQDKATHCRNQSQAWGFARPVDARKVREKKLLALKPSVEEKLGRGMRNRAKKIVALVDKPLAGTKKGRSTKATVSKL